MEDLVYYPNIFLGGDPRIMSFILYYLYYAFSWIMDAQEYFMSVGAKYGKYSPLISAVGCGTSPLEI